MKAIAVISARMGSSRFPGKPMAGFSIDASVRIEGEDRAGVERLLRYCARPPFALERLYAHGGIVSLASPEARLVYRLPNPAPTAAPNSGSLRFSCSNGSLVSFHPRVSTATDTTGS